MSAALLAVPFPGAGTSPGPASGPASGTTQVARALHLLAQSSLFDIDYYMDANPDLAGMRDGAMAHYHCYGWREGRKPNLYFDPRWYLQHQPDVAAGDMDPLLHYVLYGENEGRRPSAWFDPTWYRATYQVPEGMHALAHYLAERGSGTVSAMAEFDSPFYLRSDVSERIRAFQKT